MSRTELQVPKGIRVNLLCSISCVADDFFPKHAAHVARATRARQRTVIWHLELAGVSIFCFLLLTFISGSFISFLTSYWWLPQHILSFLQINGYLMCYTHTSTANLEKSPCADLSAPNRAGHLPGSLIVIWNKNNSQKKIFFCDTNNNITVHWLLLKNYK